MPRILLTTETLAVSLPVWATVGGFAGVGFCWSVRAVNALCRRAWDPMWRVEQSLKRASGEQRRRRDVALFALSRRTQVGRWPTGQLDPVRWSTIGSLLGPGCVIISEVLHR